MEPEVLVLWVVKLFPQPQVTSVATYSGWIPLFNVSPLVVAAGSPLEAGVNRSRTRPNSVPDALTSSYNTSWGRFVPLVAWRRPPTARPGVFSDPGVHVRRSCPHTGRVTCAVRRPFPLPLWAALPVLFTAAVVGLTSLAGVLLA